MKIKELFEKHQALLNQRRSNRTKANNLIALNKKIKQDSIKVRKQLIDEVVQQLKKKTLYEICIENFGKVDKQFYNLYQIINYEIKKKIR